MANRDDAQALAALQQDLEYDAEAIDIIATRVGGKAGEFLSGIASDLRRLNALMVKCEIWEESPPEEAN